MMKKILTTILILLLTIGCTKQQARKPVSYTQNKFMKESIERNKKLIANEETQINDIIKKDSLHEYFSSTRGYWYKYENKVDSTLATPIRGDIAYFDYEIKDLQNTIIYTKEELKPQEYYVDKEDIVIGLRNAIKLMRKGETVTFLFPSHLVYGYRGDDKKIGANQPLIYTVTLHDIKPDLNAKK
ncbi:gliding motility-associated peptidyl-prolyl isomerase GldI [Flavobacterium sp.]|uniref:gliding motility-associated peptidyl-prolyl isomerase GldI n=1 Tax=Flavobacterium sp. TaxID=239 RepID=UPI003526D00D